MASQKSIPSERSPSTALMIIFTKN